MATLAGACSSQVAEPQAEYDKQTGRLRRLAVDTNRNGRTDAVSFMDGTRIDYIEIDADENGKTERWDFYRRGQTLRQVGFSRFNDGTMDSRVIYGADQSVARIEVSTHRDGRFNRVEIYQGGALTRSEEDTNGDGRADKWETYQPNVGGAPGEPPYAIASVAFDDSGRGVPERRVFFEDHGRIQVETHFVAAAAGTQLAGQ
jgi:hypothetical protein